MNVNQRRSDLDKHFDDGFRKMSICPNRADIYLKSLPFVRKNIVNGKYFSVDHYLDVHFRLLREDFVRPLRNGINEYLCAIKRNKPYNRIDGIRVYSNVRIGDSPQNDCVFNAHLDVSEVDKIDWQNSKRLIYGSLLCLSSNDFKSFCFATVTGERDVLKLANGQFLIQFEDQNYKQVLNEFPLTMIESQVYFEAYRYNLLALKRFNCHNFPFKDYIVSVKNQIANNPYLKPKTVYNLSQLMSFSEVNATKHCLYNRVDIFNDNEWPKAKDLSLDDSQYEAFKFALLKQLVIIQGPPGTGKTYVGLKIVQTLLYNKQIWNRTIEPQIVNKFKVKNKSPILVVCYTNHALDQFLEGMLPFCDSMIRIGGRCKREALQKFTLKYLKDEKIESLSSILNSIEKRINELSSKLINCSTDLMDLESLYDIKKDSELKTQFDSLKYHYSTNLKESLLKWLFNSILETEEFKKESFEDFEDMGSVDVEHTTTLNNDSDSLDLKANNFSHLTNGVFNEEFDCDEQELKDLIDDRLDHELNYRNFKALVNENELIKSLKTCISNDFSIRFTEKQLIRLNSELKFQLSLSEIMESKEVKKIKDISQLAQLDRWRLYRSWVKSYSCYLILEIKILKQKYVEEFKRFKRLENISNLSIVSNYNPDIIGMTTTGAAKFRYIITGMKPRIVVIEEAAEVIESHVITSLTEYTEHLILIGDHQQLRPKPAVYLLAKKFGLDISLFERMIGNGLPFHQLKLQHRMRPSISGLLVPHIYKELNDHNSVKHYDNIKGISKNMFFISHDKSEETITETTSKMNRFEAQFIVGLCKYLVLQDYKTSNITILTMYSAQLFLIKELLKKELSSSKLLNGIKAQVLDSFQGEENDIILISFVRSNDSKGIGFLKVSNRINVALSRAKKGLYCIGNFNFLSQNSELWINIKNYLMEIQAIGPELELYCQKHKDNKIRVSERTDFDSFPFGGCAQTLCQESLSCGHICKMCQIINHSKLKCTKLCKPCSVSVEKTFPNCGHKIVVNCSTDISKFDCKQFCERLLQCNHKCYLECYEKCSSKPCEQLVDRICPNCSHSSKAKCSQSVTEFRCEFMCEFN